MSQSTHLRTPRGVRNCNPGNIRLSDTRWRGERAGEDSAFKCFESMAWGVRAIFHLIDNYRHLHNCQTLTEVIARWAPPSENHTESYIESVAQLSGCDPEEPLDTASEEVMLPVVAAMIRIENGAPVALKELKQGWKLFLKYRAR